MKNNILTVIIILFCNANSFAQQKMNVTEMSEYQTYQMIKELSLTKEQTEKVEIINLKYTEKMVVLMEAEGSMFGKIGEMNEIKKGKSAELEKVLSQEQLEKYEDDVAPKIKKHLRKNMKL
ncbi:hypothetical protein [uncultured Aquimarina sp.]|uniref:hypothetical protein n=1 Tax=uncultured Aquimarina sp. TaxID=575652 RepID=UPI0026052A7C|nr:hypothetical protein [uncultured Aquimarina sp.]